MKLYRRLFVLIGLSGQKMPLLLRFLWTDPGLIFGLREFLRLYQEVRSRTLVGRPRCLWLWRLVKFAARREGDVAEVGVYKGGTARILARSCPQKSVHLFDTFSGMPEVKPEIDSVQQGDFSDTSLESVKDFLKDCPNVRFHPGLFPGTVSGLEKNRFCFVNIDVDIYTSTKDCLEFFYPRMVPGGVMAFDDYKWKHCAGVKKAIDEFLAGKPEKIIEVEESQCVLFKVKSGGTAL
jgi:O-methyltransferase